MKNVLFDVEFPKETTNIKRWEVAYARTDAALRVLSLKRYPCADLLQESLKTLDQLIRGGLPRNEAGKLLEISAIYLRKARRSRALVKALRKPGKMNQVAVCSLIKRAVYEIEDAIGSIAKSDLTNNTERDKVSNQLISALFSLLSAEMQSRELFS